MSQGSMPGCYHAPWKQWKAQLVTGSVDRSRTGEPCARMLARARSIRTGRSSSHNIGHTHIRFQSLHHLWWWWSVPAQGTCPFVGAKPPYSPSSDPACLAALTSPIPGGPPTVLAASLWSSEAVEYSSTSKLTGAHVEWGWGHTLCGWL